MSSDISINIRPQSNQIISSNWKLWIRKVKHLWFIIDIQRIIIIINWSNQLNKWLTNSILFGWQKCCYSRLISLKTFQFGCLFAWIGFLVELSTRLLPSRCLARSRFSVFSSWHVYTRNTLLYLRESVNKNSMLLFIILSVMLYFLFVLFEF